VSKGNESTVIISTCTCKSTYQDDKYGKDKRVMNPYPVTEGTAHRCTICGNTTRGSAGGGPASVRRRARIVILGMPWSEYLRKASASGKTYDSRKER